MIWGFASRGAIGVLQKIRESIDHLFASFRIWNHNQATVAPLPGFSVPGGPKSQWEQSMNAQSPIRVFAMLFASVLASAAMAAEPPVARPSPDEWRQASKPVIHAIEDQLRFEAPDVTGFKVMNVRVFNQAGEKVIDLRSFGEPVEVFLGDLEDGVYLFESVAVVDNPEASEEQADTIAARNFGEFEVRAGRLFGTPDGEFSHRFTPAQAPGVITQILALVLDTLVAEAAAANLEVTSTNPTISFEDTEFTFVDDWMIEADMTAEATGTFRIINNVGGGFVEVVQIAHTAGPNRIEMRDDRLEFMLNQFGMRNGSRLGIGTALPDYTLHISEASPRIYLFDESTSSNMNLEYAAGSLIIEGDAFQDIVRIFKDAPAGTLSLLNDGRASFGGSIGIGTSNPLATLQINNTTPTIRMIDTSAGAGFMDLRVDTNRLLFEGNSGQDLAHFDTRAPFSSLWMDQAGNIGLGTSVPEQAVDVRRSGAAARFQLTSFTDTADQAPQYIQRRARGSGGAPLAVQNGDNLGLFSFRGYNGSTMGGSRATITAQAAGTFTGASTPTRLIFATTPVGQTVPQQVLVITPDGKVQVNGQNLTVPDYVFEDDYPLMPLEELRSFIDTHGHLPGIPSADEVNSEGHDLAGSDMAHLRKIEELTLYTLQQEQRLADQDRRLAEQAQRVTQLESEKQALETRFDAELDALRAMLVKLRAVQNDEQLLTAAR